MGPLIYKWDPSFINEDIYVSFGTNGTPYNYGVFMWHFVGIRESSPSNSMQVAMVMAS